MKVNLAKSAGFCFGVKRAIEIALKSAQSAKEICMLGDIVHNEEVVKSISKAGIKKINKLASGKSKTLLIRAHGVSLELTEKARRKGYRIIDATCPMVKDIHAIAKRMEKKGHNIIVIGDKKHDEVQGIIGQLRHKAIVIDGINNIPAAALKKIKKASVVVQSTQNLEKVAKIIKAVRKYIPDTQFFNTICRPTRMKQEEIRTLPLENDVVLVIGSRKSANTKRLYEISRSLNKKTHWVNSRRDILPEWFSGSASVGITAGASTPESTIREITDYVLGL